MMTSANKKKWVEALRSGKYVQGHNELAFRDDDADSGVRYCCLGVLGVVCANIPWQDLTRQGLLASDQNCGLSERDQDMFAAMNDGEPPPAAGDFPDWFRQFDKPSRSMDFDEIADVIEKYLPTED